MSFHDLPDDIRSIPLHDTVIQRDVVDLMLEIDDRRAGAIAVMVCDEGDRGVQPIVVSDVPDDAPTDGLASLLDLLLPLVQAERGSVLIARGRRRGLVPTDHDREWHQLAIDACARHGVRLLGYHLATPDGVEDLPRPIDAQAS